MKMIKFQAQKNNIINDEKDDHIKPQYGGMLRSSLLIKKSQTDAYQSNVTGSILDAEACKT